MPNLGWEGRELTKEKIDRRYIEAEEKIDRLAKSGWCVPMIGHFGMIQEAAEVEGQDELDEYFLSVYSEGDHQMLRDLRANMLAEPGLLRWEAIIDQAFSAYENSLYLVVAPTLLAVAEGAVVEIEHSPHKNLNIKNTMAKLWKSSPPESYRRLFIKSLETVMVELFKEVRFSSDNPPSLNRHWILHGRNMCEAKQVDSLRLFQLIHALGIYIKHEGEAEIV